MVNAKNGKKVMFFQTGEGTNLSGRVQAIDFMQKNNYPEEEIDDFQKVINLKRYKSKDHSWQTDDTVPEGWKYRTVTRKTGKNIIL